MSDPTQPQISGNNGYCFDSLWSSSKLPYLPHKMFLARAPNNLNAFNILSEYGVVIQYGEREQLSSWWSHRDRLIDPLIVFDIVSVLSVVSPDDKSATCLSTLPGLDGEPHPWYYQDHVVFWRLASHCHNAARNDQIQNILESKFIPKLHVLEIEIYHLWRFLETFRHEALPILRHTRTQMDTLEQIFLN